MRRGTGCQDCKLTGYVDRIAVAEVFTPTDAMRVAIAKGITALELKQLMKEAGHRSMRDAALRLVDEGVTSLEEMNRVLAKTKANGADDRRQADRQEARALADDDRMIRLLVQILLAARRLRGAGRTERPEAIDMALTLRPDLLITDLMMPEVDGYETLEALRAEAAGLIPVIVLTAETGPEVERTVLDLGADDYLSSRSTATCCCSGCAACSCDTSGSPARTTSSRRSPAPGRWRSSSARARC